MRIYEYAKARNADLDEVQLLLKDIREMPAEPHANAAITDVEVAMLDGLLRVEVKSENSQADAGTQIIEPPAGQQAAGPSIEQREAATKAAEEMLKQQAESIQKAGASMDGGASAEMEEKKRLLSEREKALAEREQALTEVPLRSSQILVEGEIFTHDDLIRHVKSKGEDPEKVDLAKWIQCHSLPNPQRKYSVSGIGDNKGKAVATQEVFAVDESEAINFVVQKQELEAYRYRFTVLPVPM